MFSIANNGIVCMNCGDTLSVPLFINAGDVFQPIRYILEETDKVFLSITEPNQPFEFGVVRKIFTKENLNAFGDIVINLVSSDTEMLLPGTYYYEIKCQIGSSEKSDIATIVPKRKFILV